MRNWIRPGRGITLGIALAVLGLQQAVAADAQVVHARKGTAHLVEPSPWQLRLRTLAVITDDKGNVNEIPGSGLSFSDTAIPELDVTYYFSDNLAAELILGTTHANIYGEGTIGGLAKIGKTWVLPPTLTLQYHFTDSGAFKPYIGAGVNYSIFYNQDTGSADALHVKNAFGGAVQVGFDYALDQHWGVNFDVKKLFLEPKFDAVVGGANVTGKAKLNPWLIGTGVSYRF
ncbi:OmpW family protein [Mesorhizobium sp. Cs1330R2N1]|uniref:OmpW family protein n=2 Tax=Mesorhizobium argentiipisi TaxID=3015175 RepID=A0ABU8K9C0_9HYPH